MRGKNESVSEFTHNCTNQTDQTNKYVLTCDIPHAKVTEAVPFGHTVFSVMSVQVCRPVSTLSFVPLLACNSEQYEYIVVGGKIYEAD